jgi:ketosteroid isomerase-like protein
MKRRGFSAVACLVGLLAVTSATAVAQPPQAPKAATSKAKPGTVDVEVRQMLAEYFKTVERHELGAFLAFFAEGEDLTVFEDKEMYDWKGFVAFAEGFFQQVKAITFELEKCRVNPLSSSVAVATGVFKGTGTATSGEPVVVHNAYTFVLIKQGERWRIKHAHESSL